MPFDPLKDLTPITRVAESPFILAAAPSFGANSLREVVERAKGASLSIGHGGNGTAMHLTAELFNAAAGIQIAMVPYRGTAPVVTDLLGGHVMLGIVDPPPSLAALRAGQIKAIAVTGGQRFPLLPEVPTFEEAGLHGFRATGWFGIVAPAGCSPEIVEKLTRGLRRCIARSGGRRASSGDRDGADPDDGRRIRHVHPFRIREVGAGCRRAPA